MESLSAKQKQSLLQTAYREFFKRVMKSLKIKKLKGQDKEVLSKLFITVKKGWPKEKKLALKAAHASSFESESSALQDAYRAFFKEMLAKFKVSSPAKLAAELKSKFYSEVKTGWAKEKAAMASASSNFEYSSLSAKQKQSLLQTAYREFFKRVMKSLKIKKLKGQDKEVLSKLFITVKKGWPKEKKAALKAATQKSTSSNFEKIYEKLDSDPYSSPEAEKFNKLKNEMLDRYNVGSDYELTPAQHRAFLRDLEKEWLRSQKSTSSDFDVDHFIVNSESSEYDYLIEAFDNDPELNGGYESVSSASSEAKKLGLTHVGFGKWANKKGKVVKMTVHGKLVGIREGKSIKKHVAALKVHNKKYHDAFEDTAQKRRDGKSATYGKAGKHYKESKSILNALSKKHGDLHAQKAADAIDKSNQRRYAKHVKNGNTHLIPE